jgi:Holliday junction resolvase-like predicted endonuclease
MRYYHPLTDTITEVEGDWSIPLDDRRSTDEATCFTDAFQFAWDSTSLGALKTCPRKYLYTIIQGWMHKILPPPLSFGIHYHTCMETWHKLLTHDIPKEECFLRVVRLAGLLGESIPHGDNTRTKETLCRSVAWYIEQFWEDSARTVHLSSGKAAVEYSFTLPFGEIDGIDLYLCGHIDRLVQFQGGIYPTDYKTSKSQLDSRFFAKFKPSNQQQIYTTAVHILSQDQTSIPLPPAGVIIDGLQLGVNYTRFQRQVIPFSIEEIEDFIGDAMQWISIAKLYAETNHWPANEEACDMYGGCHFREACKQKPAQRELVLRSNFVKRVWDPLKAR